eukprot:1155224-Pelagomonas_calceolata.AAC.11
MGADKLQQAMSETLGNEEAAPLFDQAGEHFRDAAVVSLIQWGNVFIVKADRLLQALTKAGKPIKGKDLDAVMALYDATQKKCVLYECMHSAVRHDGKKGGVKMQDAGEGKKGFRLICAAGGVALGEKKVLECRGHGSEVVRLGSLLSPPPKDKKGKPNSFYPLFAPKLISLNASRGVHENWCSTQEYTRRVEEGLRVKPDSWEAAGSLAQLECESLGLLSLLST